MSSRRSEAFLAVARPYVRRLLARELDGIEIAGLAELRRLTRERPLVCAMMHTSFWDPLVLVALEAALPGTGHALMDAGSLARLPFFGLLGAVPLERRDHARALDDLDRAASLVRHAGERLWIFPQGRQRPSHLRPLALRPGVVRVARRAGAAVVPVALTYAFREAMRPACVLAVGSPVSLEVLTGRPADASAIDAIEAGLVAALARIDAHLEVPDAGFETLVQGATRRPDHTTWSALLARLTGGRGWTRS